MTGTNCDLFTHNQPRSYLNHLVFADPEHGTWPLSPFPGSKILGWFVDI
jgi:hypothetical protein